MRRGWQFVLLMLLGCQAAEDGAKQAVGQRYGDSEAVSLKPLLCDCESLFPKDSRGVYEELATLTDASSHACRYLAPSLNLVGPMRQLTIQVSQVSGHMVLRDASYRQSRQLQSVSKTLQKTFGDGVEVVGVKGFKANGDRARLSVIHHAHEGVQIMTEEIYSGISAEQSARELSATIPEFYQFILGGAGQACL